MDTLLTKTPLLSQSLSTYPASQKSNANKETQEESLAQPKSASATINQTSVKDLYLTNKNQASIHRMISKTAQPAIKIPHFPAPDFEVKQTKRGVKNTTLYQLLDKGKPVILFFYPKQGSPFCKKQVARMHEQFGANQDVQLIGVSYKQPQAGSGAVEGIRFLVDTSGKLQKQYGVGVLGVGLLTGLGYSERVTFVIDPKTRLAYRVASDMGLKHASEAHIQNAIKMLCALKQK